MNAFNTTSIPFGAMEGLGRMFYVISPARSSFATLEEVPNYVTQAIPYFFLTVGLELVAFAVGHEGGGAQERAAMGKQEVQIGPALGSNV
ncbi:hypothetical protein BC936DRAFT_142499 [Jimgerdemannia flammicorona]|uniref:Uncharacterized protein n=1 Tax=Jimgerdemannia flammicorona TaxID=994334 RepID=A0A433A097_9FUNG|nr:hypothetical protein BC936DRAFT_142499 [Jimgerdemannia flammicorona]